MIANIFIIATLCCFIVNSGAIDSLKRLIWRWLKGKTPYKDYSLKPLDCELCLTWWCGIVYLLCSADLTLSNIAIVALSAWLTPVIVDVMHIIVELPRWGLDKLRGRI